MPEIETLIRLEREVWQALADGDRRADGRLLAAEFLGVYPSGFSDRAGHMDQLSDGPTVTSFELADARMLALGSDSAMLSYVATYTRPGGAVEPEVMYVSSLWCRRDGEWRNLFSQDTPAL